MIICACQCLHTASYASAVRELNRTVVDKVKLHTCTDIDIDIDQVISNDMISLMIKIIHSNMEYRLAFSLVASKIMQ